MAHRFYWWLLAFAYMLDCLVEVVTYMWVLPGIENWLIGFLQRIHFGPDNQ